MTSRFRTLLSLSAVLSLAAAPALAHPHIYHDNPPPPPGWASPGHEEADWHGHDWHERRWHAHERREHEWHAHEDWAHAHDHG